MQTDGRIFIVIRDFREDEKHHTEIEKSGRYDYSVSGGAYQPGVTRYIHNLFSRKAKYKVQPECMNPEDAKQFRELLEQCQRDGFNITIAETRHVSGKNNNYRSHV